PTLLQLVSTVIATAHGSAAPAGVALWTSVVASLALALGVMIISFIVTQSLEGSADLRGRAAAHVAFATPSLFVGFGNVANLWHAPVAALIAWPMFWAAIAAVVLAPRRSAAAEPISAANYRRLAIGH